MGNSFCEAQDSFFMQFIDDTGRSTVCGLQNPMPLTPFGITLASTSDPGKRRTQIQVNHSPKPESIQLLDAGYRPLRVEKPFFIRETRLGGGRPRCTEQSNGDSRAGGEQPAAILINPQAFCFERRAATQPSLLS
jgi:hypothetical protein